MLSVLLGGLALQRPTLPHAPVRSARRPHLSLRAAQNTEKEASFQIPDLPPPSQEGGQLSWLLPVSLLIESQEANRVAAGDLMVGEDAGTFAWKNEKMGRLGERDWLTFFAAVGTILSALAVLWIYPATGYSDDFMAWLEGAAGGNSHLVTLFFGLVFPLVHSGLASLRPYGERVVGARTWRVIFASCSLPLSYSWIVYFISHAHDGLVFWDGESVAAVHAAAWCVNFASFFL